MINTKIKEFKAQAFQKGKKDFFEVSNETLKGKWVVLFFYPADFTFVCPTELVDLQDHYEELQKMNVEVLSVSTDTVFTHSAWHNHSDSIKKISYPMLADPTGNLSKNFNVYIEEEGLATRGTFLINPDGVIKIIEINDNGIGRNAEELVRKIKAAQYIHENPNEVCPAKWKKGEKTLKPGLDLVGKL